MQSTVSVIISSYNSSPFIIEALNSVSEQTWRQIELIISDDCSRDATVDICRNWLKENGSRFLHAEIITSNINTGISVNANRGLNLATGDWVKFLAADDTLKPYSVEDNMSWIDQHSEIKALFSQIEIYKDTFEPENLIARTPDIPYDECGILAEGRNAESQYQMLLTSDRIHFSPSVFLHRETLLSVGRFDERFKLIEDYPLWLKLTRAGHKLYFMDKTTVNYRQHNDAINNTQTDYLVKPNYFRTEEFRRIYIYPYLPRVIILSKRWEWFASQIFCFDFLNNKKILNRFLHAFLTIYINPFKCYIFFKKQFDKKLKDNKFYNY